MSTARITYALILGALAFIYLIWVTRSKKPDRPWTEGLLRVWIFWIITLLFVQILGGLNLISGVQSLLLAILPGLLLYQLLLLLILPILRKVVRAEGCASLWLLPSLLYPTFFSRMLSKFEPLFFIPVRRTIVPVLAWVWIVGALVSLIWRIVSHLRLRRQILHDAVPADSVTLCILGKVCKELCVEPRGALMVSPAVRAPVSIGVIEKSMMIVLPAEKSYTEQELRLILRHETVHLAHRDNLIKLFIAFITSVGWFLPLQRLGMVRASEDLELNCDEAVVRGFSEAEKRLYAELLINNAGSAKGFTTCLSASAAGLRYRLKRLVRPGKRLSGALIGMLLMAAFTLSIGTVAFAYDGQPLNSIFQDSLKGEDSLRIRLPLDRPKAEWNWSDSYYYRYYQDYSCEREEELTEYLSGITVYSCESHHSPGIVYTVSANLPQPEVWNQDWITIGRIIFTPPEYGFSFIVAPSGTYVTTDAIDLDYLRSFAGDSLEMTE